MRNTIAKAKILELINHSEVALSHSEIEKLTEGLCNRVTIYRVLDRLTDEGHIHRFINIDGHQKFAACHHCDAQHHHNHAHFSCTQCGTVSCLEDVEPVYKLPKEYKVQDMNFILSGVCPRCVK